MLDIPKLQSEEGPPEDSTPGGPTHQVAIDVAEIRTALKSNPEFFIHFFLHEELSHDVPELHIELFSLMVGLDVPRFVAAVPRDHAKTTMARLAAVYHLLFLDFNFIIYMSASTELAIPSANAIVAFLESDNCRSVFGPLLWEVNRPGEGVYIFRIPSLDNKLCIIKPFGIGKTVRGLNERNKRPDLAIADDVENNENIATDALFKKVKKWWYGTFIKALDKFNNKVIQLGNLTITPSLLWMHLQSQHWFSRHYGVLREDGSPLWPDAWPLEKLAADFQQYQEVGEVDTWFAEMMNVPMAPGGGIIEASEITYMPHRDPDDLSYGFLTVDLAISAESWGHKTVVCAHGWVEAEQIWQVVQYKFWHGIDPIQLFWEIVEICQTWNIFIVGIEDEAYQASLKFVYRHLCLLHGVEGLSFVPLFTYKRGKTSRIVSWASQLKQSKGHYALTVGDFAATQQLLTYDPKKKENDDDIIDCIAYGPQMTDNYIMEIMAARSDRPTHTATPLVAIAQV